MALAFPFPVDENSIKCHFDCKIRRLFVHAVKSEAAAQPTPEVEVFEEDRAQPAQISEINAKADDEEVIEEIDTDEHFGRGKDTGKVQTYFDEQSAPAENKNASSKDEPAGDEDDLLYDLC